MDIKTEPDDELLSSNLPEKAHNDDNHQDNTIAVWKDDNSIDIKYETIVKQEEIIDDEKHRDFMTDVSNDHQNVKSKEEEIQYRSCEEIKIENIEIAECSYSRQKPDEFHTALPTSSPKFEQPSMDSIQNPLHKEKCMNKQEIKTEILQSKLVAVIMMENGVFYERNFICGVCFHIYPSLNILKKHVTIHGKLKFDNKGISKDKQQKVFRCNESNFKSLPSNCMKKHKMRHFRDKSFKCNQCSETFTSMSQLKNHYLTHSTERLSQIELKKVSKTEVKKIKCDQCSYRSSRVSVIKRHKLKHTGEKPFKCDLCSFKTAFESNIKTHKLSHTGEKPFKCDQCSFKSALKRGIQRHILTHTGEKPFKCDVCSFASSRESNLQRHKLRHSGEKPFECDLCSFKSARASTTKAHKLSHTGELPFKCDQCWFKTARAFDLKKHKILHGRETI